MTLSNHYPYVDRRPPPCSIGLISLLINLEFLSQGDGVIFQKEILLLQKRKKNKKKNILVFYILIISPSFIVVDRRTSVFSLSFTG